MTVTCPGCGAPLDLGPMPRENGRYACPSCAGREFTWMAGALKEIPMASCPACGRTVDLPDGVEQGDTFSHCGRSYTVTLEYGSYALEGAGEPGKHP